METVDNGNGYKLSIEQRLTKLETIVDEIKNNHLVHIEAKIDRVTWFILVTLVGVVVSFVK